jgi:peptide deformylase
MVRDIIQLGDLRLYKKSEPVAPGEIKSQKVKKIVRDMLDTCEIDSTSTGGLSAVQIGELKRIFVVNRFDGEKQSDPPKWEVLINPELHILTDKMSSVWEGCLSVGVGDERLFGPVTRPDKVKATYLGLDGQRKEMVGEGYLSHVLQHEYDHLEGILFLKYITDPRNIWKSKDLDAYLEEHEEFPAEVMVS